MVISIEYYIMRYLILFEKDKSLEEITFQYQNTMNFRRDEKKLKRNILICYLSINFIWISGWLSNFVYDSVYTHNYPCGYTPTSEIDNFYKTWLYTSLGMIGFVILIANTIATCTFIHLFYLLRKRHFFEF